MSTFHGLEMAKQALFTQQAALYTTGHNISNANTEGYSRQRVNFETMNPYPSASRNRPQIPGQMGTGVQAGSVQRIRDQFLDVQFRGENSKSGYYETRADALSRMENILNEPSDSGLDKTMDNFWQSLQDLAVNPKNSGARSVVLQRGEAVADTFNYLSNSLNSIRGDLKLQLENTEDKTNSLLNQINEINKQVKQIEPHGYLPNDLYDERDRLIDELSNIVDIDVDYDNKHSALDIAQGVATITLQGDSSVTLVDGVDGDFNEMKIEFSAEGENEAVSSITVGGDEVSQTLQSNGSLGGLVGSYGYSFADGTEGGLYPDKLSKLNEMALAFAKAFNDVHETGYDLEGNKGMDFFKVSPSDGVNKGAAGLIKVNPELTADKIAASSKQDDAAGDGGMALKLAEVFNDPNEYLDDTSINEFYQSIIGTLGVDAQEANRMADNTLILRSQVENQRLSVSSVSLDEEMSNMIKFQHAYNAAARSMTSVDEMIDRIINNMGIVGR